MGMGSGNETIETIDGDRVGVNGFAISIWGGW